MGGRAGHRENYKSKSRSDSFALLEQVVGLIGALGRAHNLLKIGHIELIFICVEWEFSSYLYILSARIALLFLPDIWEKSGTINLTF